MVSDLPGRLIAGRYRLGTVVGRGGMGIVWQARDELLGRDVAVKELAWPATCSAGERQAARRRVVREAKAAARLGHRNVVQVFDILEDGGSPWIVMELLPPRSLRDLIDQEGPLSPARAAQLGLEILSALRAAHAAGIVHRDVKPANILVSPGRAVLVDFGIAQAAEASVDATTASMLMGSPAYIAPERARGGLSGPPADLWGLGASLYAAVEGSGPFEREGGALASLAAVVADQPERATRAGPLLWPVIDGLLRKDPGERLDAVEAERMLRLAVAPASPVRTVTRGRRSPKAAVGALVGSAMLIAASATVAVIDRPGHAPGPAPAAAASTAAKPGAQPTTAHLAGGGPHHPGAGPATGAPAGTHLTSRTSPPVPSVPAAGPAGPSSKSRPDDALPPGPPGHSAWPGKPGQANGQGKGKARKHTP